MKAVFLDADSLALDRQALAPVEGALEELVCHGHTRYDQTAERIGDAAIVIVNKVVLDAAVLEAAPNLRLVCIAATGVNNVDLDAAARLGITVTNCRGYGTDSVAQHTIGLILALATSLQPYTADVRAGRWGQSRFFCLLDHPIVELAGKRLGIIGLGTLGQRVAELGAAFGMEVVAAERPGSRKATPGRIPVPELLASADVVSIHCPMTEHTRGLIGARELERMKPTAFLINTARGGIVDEKALADALRRGKIAGAGVDVLSAEPPADGNPLLADDIPNLIVTPHSAWGSREARLRIVDQLAENIAGFRGGQTPRQVT
jgi:glycerate dehydrogenase